MYRYVRDAAVVAVLLLGLLVLKVPADVAGVGCRRWADDGRRELAGVTFPLVGIDAEFAVLGDVRRFLLILPYLDGGEDCAAVRRDLSARLVWAL